jgi:cytochrome bd ubiquinol oxidase subunit II
MTLVAFWFLVLTVLWVGFFVLEGFDFGVGMLHGVVGRDEAGRRAVIATIGPLWDGNEVWLIVAAAGTFAAFPGWYATMFSGFYPVFLLVLVGLIVRGVAFEFGSHSESDGGRRIWGLALRLGSLVVPFGLGVVLGSLLGGVPIDSKQEFVGGLGDLLRPYALATGVTLTLLSLLHGAAFLSLRTAGELRIRATRVARAVAPVTALAVLGFCIWTRVVSDGGFLLSSVEFAAVLAVIAAVVLVRRGDDGPAFAATTVSIATVVVSLFAELYPRVMVSSLSNADDLTAQNTASASYALTVMTVVLVVLLPVVLLYQGWTYHVFRGRLRGPRVDSGGSGGPVVPPPRRGSDVLAESGRGGSPARTAGQVVPPGVAATGESRPGNDRIDGSVGMRSARRYTGLVASVAAWRLLRQVVLRSRPH